MDHEKETPMVSTLGAMFENCSDSRLDETDLPKVPSQGEKVSADAESDSHQNGPKKRVGIFKVTDPENGTFLVCYL